MPPGVPVTMMVTRSAGTATLTVAGELDAVTAPRFRTALGELLTAGHARIEVDLTATTFVGSQAAMVLIDARRRAAAAGSTVRVLGARRITRDVLRILGWED